MSRRRRGALLLGVVGIASIVLFATQSHRVRAWFVRDAESQQELAKLATTKLTSTPIAESGAGWPQWRGPHRDGRAPACQFRTDWDKSPPSLVWSTSCGPGYSSCAVVNGKVFTQDRHGGDERVICLNAADGRQLWEYSYPAEQAGNDANFGHGPRAMPAILGDVLVAVGGAGKLLCLQLPTGNETPRLRWQHDLLREFDAKMPQWGVACSPLIEQGLVIVQPGGKNGSVAAFDLANGALAWSAGTSPSGYSSPVAATIGGERTVFAFTSDSLLTVSLAGRLTDSYPWPTRFSGNIATPIVVDDYVFISSAYGQGCALLRAERREGEGVKLVEVYARRRKGFQNHHGTSIYRDRFLYGFDGDTVARLKCIEFATGREKEGWDAAGLDKGTLILAETHLIVQTERGDLALVEANPEEFRMIAKIPRVLSGNNNWATPALVDGMLYLRDDEKVACYDIRPQ
jgi:outer membrane protein assembly factor BamB